MHLEKRDRSFRAVLAVMFLLILNLVASSSLSVNADTSWFGNSSVGTSSSSTFGGTYLSRFISPEDFENVTLIQLYLSTGGTTAKSVIYSDNNGKPDTLLAASTSVTLAGTSGSWVNFDISYVGSPNTVYWLGVAFQTAATYYYTDSTEGGIIYSAPGADTPSVFPLDASSQPGELSIYAAYTSSASSSQGGDSLQSLLFWVIIIGLIVATIVAVAFVVLRRRSPGSAYSL